VPITDEMKAIIAAAVKDELQNFVERLNNKASSSAIEKTAGGKIVVKCKVYDADPVAAINKTLAGWKHLAKQISGDDFQYEDMPPFEAYYNDAPAAGGAVPTGSVDAEFEDVAPANQPSQAFDGDDGDDGFD